VSNEAAAGKNPVSHIGKIYNLLTHRIAEQIYKDVPGLEEVYVWLLSQIGKPIDQPKIIAVQVVQNKKGVDAEFLKKDIEKIVDEKLDKENINKFTNDLIYKKMPVC
jgi:S-adenosylmethionine synthetase